MDNRKWGVTGATVKMFVDKLKQDEGLQVFDLPFDQGVTLVRKLRSGAGGQT